MLTVEENEQMTRVGPGTPMGELLRRYWHPVVISSPFTGVRTRPVRLLGEDLVLYRDPSGTLGLVGNRCPHRRAGMVFGIPDPMNVFRDLSKNVCINLPVDRRSFRFGDRTPGSTRTGQAGKYSPILAEVVRKTQGEEKLREPVH